MPGLGSLLVLFQFYRFVSENRYVSHSSEVAVVKMKFNPTKLFRKKKRFQLSASVDGEKAGFIRPPSNKVQRKDSLISGIFIPENGQLYEGFSITEDDVVLDVGCGDGCIALFAAGRRAKKVIATDVDPKNVEFTKKKLASYNRTRDFEVHLSDSNPLPLANNTATKVICREVLEHVDDPVAIMKELVRVGTPDASFLITVPDPVGEKLQQGIAPDAYWEKPNHVRIFEREEFAQLLEQAGLVVEQRQSHGFYWSMWWVLFWAAGQELGEPEKPILGHWTSVWNELISTPKGEEIKVALDEFMPKSQVLIAKKAA